MKIKIKNNNKKELAIKNYAALELSAVGDTLCQVFFVASVLHVCVFCFCFSYTLIQSIVDLMCNRDSVKYVFYGPGFSALLSIHIANLSVPRHLYIFLYIYGICLSRFDNLIIFQTFCATSALHIRLFYDSCFPFFILLLTAGRDAKRAYVCVYLYLYVCFECVKEMIEKSSRNEFSQRLRQILPGTCITISDILWVALTLASFLLS